MSQTRNSAPEPPFAEHNITEREIPLLGQEFNLTDGHVYRSWSREEATIIGRASELLLTASRQDQLALEADYLDVFFCS